MRAFWLSAIVLLAVAVGSDVIAEEGVVAFDPASLTPYFVEGPLGKASERLRSGDPVAARAKRRRYGRCGAIRIDKLIMCSL